MSSVAVEPQATCHEAGCSFSIDGQCLEGLPTGIGCPNLVPAGVEPEDELGAESSNPDANGADARIEEPPTSAVPVINLDGEEALSVDDADRAIQDESGIVVLVAGEFECGKTTLMTEIYSQFLDGPFDGWTFAGSRTLIALDERHRLARAASGNEHPDTPRTGGEDMRLLHLRLCRKDRELILLTSDVKGEFFEHVIGGLPVGDEVPLAQRADRCLILLDGERMKDVFDRQKCVTRTRLLIGGLTEAAGVPKGTSTAIVVAKADVLDDAERAWCEGQAAALAAFASSRGLDARPLCVAARPRDPVTPVTGLDEVLQFLDASPKAPEPAVPRLERDLPRIFWRLDSVEGGLS